MVEETMNRQQVERELRQAKDKVAEVEAREEKSMQEFHETLEETLAQHEKEMGEAGEKALAEQTRLEAKVRPDLVILFFFRTSQVARLEMTVREQAQRLADGLVRNLSAVFIAYYLDRPHRYHNRG